MLPSQEIRVPMDPDEEEFENEVSLLLLSQNPAHSRVVKNQRLHSMDDSDLEDEVPTIDTVDELEEFEEEEEEFEEDEESQLQMAEADRTWEDEPSCNGSSHKESKTCRSIEVEDEGDAVEDFEDEDEEEEDNLRATEAVEYDSEHEDNLRSMYEGEILAYENDSQLELSEEERALLVQFGDPVDEDALEVKRITSDTLGKLAAAGDTPLFAEMGQVHAGTYGCFFSPFFFLLHFFFHPPFKP